MELGNNLDCYILIRNQFLLVAYSRQKNYYEERLTQGKSRGEPAHIRNFVIKRKMNNRCNRERLLEREEQAFELP